LWNFKNGWGPKKQDFCIKGRIFVRSFTKKNQEVLMKIVEMADVFLNSANFVPHAFLTL
jgi:hypothetical protein